jgi:TIR domain
MAESAGPSSGGIFISYRREETAYPAGWLYDRLVDHFGGGHVFKDVDSIELGDDFVEVISSAVGSCDVLLALIGDRWLAITDEDGRRRLDDAADFVRLEIEAALTRNVRVIPILVEGARMPRVAELPPSLAKLARRQALELSPARFDFDTSRLLRVLDRTLDEVRTAAQDDAAAIPAPADKAPDRSTRDPDRHAGAKPRVRPPSPPPPPPQNPILPSRRGSGRRSRRSKDPSPLMTTVESVVSGPSIPDALCSIRPPRCARATRSAWKLVSQDLVNSTTSSEEIYGVGELSSMRTSPRRLS